MSSGPRERLARYTEQLGLNVDQSDRLWRYLELIEKWNQVHNLTAVRGADNMLRQHLFDSLAVLPHLTGGTVLDVGSGAGLPGIPIAIARPQLAVTLLDSSHKRAAFLRHATAELALAHVQVVAARVESFVADRRYDSIVSRAFAELADFVQLAHHLLAPGGTMLAMKGLHPFEEIARLPAGFCVREVVRLAVPELDAERHLVVIERRD